MILCQISGFVINIRFRDSLKSCYRFEISTVGPLRAVVVGFEIGILRFANIWLKPRTEDTHFSFRVITETKQTPVQRIAEFLSVAAVGKPPQICFFGSLIAPFGPFFIFGVQIGIPQCKSLYDMLASSRSNRRFGCVFLTGTDMKRNFSVGKLCIISGEHILPGKFGINPRGRPAAQKSIPVELDSPAFFTA